MHSLPQHWSPVYNHSAYSIVLEDYIFYRVAVENCCTGMNGFIKQCRCALHRIHNIQVAVVLFIIDFKLLYYMQSLLLYNNLVEHHGTSPHATSRREFPVELGHFQSGLCKIIGSNNT